MDLASRHPSPDPTWMAAMATRGQRPVLTKGRGETEQVVVELLKKAGLRADEAQGDVLV